MSHWTRCKTQIKDLEVLRQAARSLGVNVKGRNKKYNSKYDSTFHDALVEMEYKDGTAAVIKTADGINELMIDNFCNPITEKLGNDCSLLGREYSKKLVEKQAMLMGGVVTSSTLLSTGEVQMQISI